jgi:hypothetical protein
MKAQLRTQPQRPQPHSFLPVRPAVLQRKCACGGTPGATAECPACAKKSKRFLQRELLIGASNDPLEQEADRVADLVMRAPTHSAPPRIQRFAGRATEGTETAPPSVDRVLASSGRPLNTTLQQKMERRFGHDFSRVRVHSGAAAEQSAREVNANAYTAGHNIVFGAGRFMPGTHRGRHLIAHELTHVVQQAGSRATGIQRQPADPQLQQPPTIAANATEIVPTGTPGTNTTTLTITGAPKTAYDVGVTVTASRGHSHTAPGRPLGGITPSATVTTDDDGTATVIYTAAIVAGEEHITVKKSGEADAPQAALDITVRVADLTALGAGTGYSLIGQTATHPDNHYGTAGAISAYQAVGTSWAAIPETVTSLVEAIQEARKQPNAPAPPTGGPLLTNAHLAALLLLPTQAALDLLSNAQLAQVIQAVSNWPTLGYNDMSLVYGGVFDINATWAPPHITHRVGTNMDFRLSNMGALHQLVVEPLMEGQGLNVLHENAAHWHLTAP